MVVFFSQRSTTCGPRKIEEEMAERWHPGPVLHEAEEDEAGTDREEQPSQGFDDENRSLRRDCWTSSIRCDDLHRERPQRTSSDPICSSAEADGPLRSSRKFSTIPAISRQSKKTSISSRAPGPPSAWISGYPCNPTPTTWPKPGATPAGPKATRRSSRAAS